MFCAIDFEFNRPADPDMGLISVSLAPECQGTENPATETFWLQDPEDQREAFLERLKELGAEGYTFLGYFIQLAEARCIAALGLDPNIFKWRDLSLDWRWLRNGDYRYSHGPMMKQIGSKDGVPQFAPMFTVPPEAKVSKKASQEELDEAKEINDRQLQMAQGIITAETTEGDEETEAGLSEVGQSLLDCCYFFGVITANEYRGASVVKARVRDEIIVKGLHGGVEANKDAILEYNSADVKDMLRLAEKIHAEMVTVGQEGHYLCHHGESSFEYVDESGVQAIQLGMGAWAARLAKYAHRGIPLHMGRVHRLLEVAPILQTQVKRDWNKDFPETPLYRVGFSEAMLEKRKNPLKDSPFRDPELTLDAKFLEGLIENYKETSGLEAYPKTRTGKPDTSKRVIDRYASGDNLLKQFQRHQNNLTALKTYTKGKDGKVEAMEYIGSDGKQRANFGPFGTQTARNAAKAKSLIFLNAHWMRVLIDPEPSMAIIELDYSSQEVFIAAVQSGDKNLKEAYASNDVYMHYAQLTGMYPAELPIPTEEQREEEWFKPWKKIRNTAKVVVLSTQYGAGYKAVAAAVRDAIRNLDVTDEMGKGWVNGFNEAYLDYSRFVKETRDFYSRGTGLMLSSGWRIGHDNPSVLSASNFPIQGAGAVILQRACRLMDEAGLTVIATLHDAVSVYCKEDEAQEVARKGAELMKQASFDVLGEWGMRVGPPEIIRHGQIWCHSPRAKEAWDKLSANFEGLY